MKALPSRILAILEVVVLAVVCCSVFSLQTVVDIPAGKQADIKLWAKEFFAITAQILARPLAIFYRQ